MKNDQMTNIFVNILEKARRPGLMGIVGKAVERRCYLDLEGYFKNVGEEIIAAHLEDLSTQPVLLAKHAAEMKLYNILRRHRSVLQTILQTNIHEALLKADKMTQIHEADVTISYDDTLGLTGQAAADYASAHSAEAVVGIDQTTLEQIQDAIATGIEDELGVAGTGRLIRDLIDGMSTKRAATIASYEMNDAFSEATMQKLDRLGIEYKKWICSDDPCPECEQNEDQIIPVDDTFDSGDDRPPVHPHCRCAVVGARAPETSE